jgi:hypothetical protein
VGRAAVVEASPQSVAAFGRRAHVPQHFSPPGVHRADPRPVLERVAGAELPAHEVAIRIAYLVSNCQHAVGQRVLERPHQRHRWLSIARRSASARGPLAARACVQARIPPAGEDVALALRDREHRRHLVDGGCLRRGGIRADGDKLGHRTGASDHSSVLGDDVVEHVEAERVRSSPARREAVTPHAVRCEDRPDVLAPSRRRRAVEPAAEQRRDERDVCSARRHR